jgi:uncharacterized protein
MEPEAAMGSHGARVRSDRSARLHAVRQVLLFVVVTYALTWSLFLEAARLGDGATRLPLLIIGSFAPSAVAVALTARGEGSAGVRALLAGLLRWRVGLRWYVFALGFMAAVKLGVAVVVRLTQGSWPELGGQPWIAVLPAIVAAGIAGGPLGEEIGWRGYALPRLTEGLGLATASVLLGVVWACWHLPLFFLAGLAEYGDQFGQSFPTYLLQVTALCVALAWLFSNTGGSLLLVVLMHSAINQTKDLVPSRVPGADDMWALSGSTPAWVTVGLLWICAAFFLSRMHGHHADRPGAPLRFRSWKTSTGAS